VRQRASAAQIEPGVRRHEWPAAIILMPIERRRALTITSDSPSTKPDRAGPHIHLLPPPTAIVGWVQSGPARGTRASAAARDGTARRAHVRRPVSRATVSPSDDAATSHSPPRRRAPRTKHCGGLASCRAPPTPPWAVNIGEARAAECGGAEAMSGARRCRGSGGMRSRQQADDG
jgi:hypothetical protein